ncbi:MAG: glycine betaine/L-proline ABC transporter substrate-binding protein ProX [Crinalium sp.]
MKQRRKKQIFTIAVVVALVVSLIACHPTSETTKSPSSNRATELELPGKGVKVSPGSFNSVSTQFVSEIANFGLKKLGYEVEELKILNATVLFLALGNDEIDVAPTFEYAHANFFEKAGGEKKLERIGLYTPSNILRSYVIDRKTAEQYKITNLVQLKDPEVARLFDSDGDGKANLLGCDPGTACEQVIDYHLKVYGLENTVIQDKGQWEIIVADILARYKQGKSILYFIQNSDWVNAVLQPDKDVISLEVPFTTLPGEMGKKVTQKDTTADGKNLGFPVDKGRFVSTRQFLVANPAAKRWFEQIQVPSEDILAEEKLAREKQSNLKDIRRDAEEWVKKHQSQVDGWLAEARLATKAS